MCAMMAKEASSLTGVAADGGAVVCAQALAPLVSSAQAYLFHRSLNAIRYWRLIVGADPRTFGQFVNAQPLTCRRQLLVP
jgi:hypothetical protein